MVCGPSSGTSLWFLNTNIYFASATPVVKPADSENPDQEAGINDGQEEEGSEERANENTILSECKSRHKIAPNAERMLTNRSCRHTLGARE